jgi:Purple acid Phosphatase, N-terminal domain
MRILNRTLVAVVVLAVCLVVTAAAQQNIQITSGPTAQQVTDNSATITWGTNVNASTMVLYGSNQGAVQQQKDIAWPTQNTAASGDQPGVQQQPWGGTNHTVQLTNLQPGTTYYYSARSSGAEGTGTMTTSNIATFTTTGSASASNAGSSNSSGTGQNITITTGPAAQNVTRNSATITWDTNAPGSNMVMYGTDSNALQAQASQGWPDQARPMSGSNPGLAEKPWGGTHHAVDLTNLQPGTTYYVIVRSTSGQGTGTMTTSPVYSFSTSK